MWGQNGFVFQTITHSREAGGKEGGGGGRDDELDRPLEHLYRISLLRFIERRTKILGCFSATITLNERC